MDKKILIVDDEPNIVVSLEFLMKREGFRVTAVSDGDEAIASLRTDVPDLILLDVMMPKVSGYEVVDFIRGEPRLAGVKIVMLSAKGRESEIAKGLAIGADAYVTKPFSTKELAMKVRELLGLA